MSLQDRLADDLKQALRSGDDTRKRTIRMLMASMKNAQIEKRAPLDDQQELSVVQREAKRRREAADEYRKIARNDLADGELAELGILQEYLPAQLSESEVRDIIDRAIRDTGAASQRDMGRVMAQVTPQIRGRADGKMVSQLVREALGDRQAAGG